MREKQKMNKVKKNKLVLATLSALFAQVIFGFSFMFTKIALNYSAPMTVIANRYMVAFLGMTVVLFATKTKIKISKNIWKMLLMSVFQPLLYFVFESYGIKMTTSSFSSIMISLIPVVAMISGIFFLNEKPLFMQYVFTALSVLGVVITALVGKSDGTVTALGIILLFGAVLSSTGYNILSRKISGEFTAFERTYVMTLVGLVFFSAIAFAENVDNPIEIITPFLSVPYAISVLYLGIVSSVVAFIFLNYANTHLPVARTTVFSNITTVVSVIAGAVFLDEKISSVSILAVVMIIIGVFGVQIAGVRKNNSSV
ncbi:MAG: DMT family transporter [Clostridia bacterium]|nr:DMT family transporter [Clostridia bacterium]